ncbi:MAG: adenosylhomocysteinase [Dehalococcoidia bacterium]|nr:adenosylhomocysteinase [Dehalococcoidia bacterium]
MKRKFADSDVKDITLAKSGVLRIEWAAREMPVLKLIAKRFAKAKPLTGCRIAACLHVTTETANLALTLKAGGADVVICASNPLSTQDDVSAALAVEYNIPTFAIKGEDNETYYRHIRRALDHAPQITMDDGADLVSILHKERTDLISKVVAGTEETTTGVIRLRSMHKARKLKYPIIAVNDAMTKHLFDNRYGTGQSTIDGITRATNTLWAGKKVVVCGYGWCGRGIASRASGMGSQVIVIEVDPIRALEALMEGYQVMPLAQASGIGDIFITATGDVKVIDRSHMDAMKDGVILANSGHFNVEINIPELEKMAKGKRQVRPAVTEYHMLDGRHLFLLGEGRLINLAAAEGHPASVMDMSFANQALSVEHLWKSKGEMKPNVYSVPEAIDKEVGKLKLTAMGVSIDALTREQKRYLGSWESGT